MYNVSQAHIGNFSDSTGSHSTHQFVFGYIQINMLLCTFDTSFIFQSNTLIEYMYSYTNVTYTFTNTAKINIDIFTMTK